MSRPSGTHLQHEIPRRRHRSAARGAAAFPAPPLLLRHRIPRDQQRRRDIHRCGPITGGTNGADWRRFRRRARVGVGRRAGGCRRVATADAGVASAFLEDERTRVDRVGGRVAERGRDVHQAGLRIERHRRPVVRAARARDRSSPARFRRTLRGLTIGRPVFLSIPLAQFMRRKRRRRNELAGDAIDHVEEAVLVRLHDDLALAAVDRDVGQHQLLHAS